jgi:hypothetical protein
MQSKVETYTATIYVGSRERYDGAETPLDIAEAWLQRYVDREGLCVSVTRTRFIYTNGSEPGLIVGLINYPRFPSRPEFIREQALEIGEHLRALMRQQRVSVVFPDETVMLPIEL